MNLYNFKFTVFCDCGRPKDEPHDCFWRRLDKYIQTHPVEVKTDEPSTI